MSMASAASALVADAHWRGARRLTLEQARRRSDSVRVWRWGFAGLAALCALSIFAALAVHSLGGGYLFEEPIAAEESLTMRAPRFTGRSTDGDRFVITAETAVRQSQGSNLIDLSQPRMETESGRIVTAERGIYHVVERTIGLSGAVNFYEPNGTRMATASSTFDGKRNIAKGLDSVVVSGPLGEVRANAYEINQEQGKIVLSGEVRGLIRSESERDALRP